MDARVRPEHDDEIQNPPIFVIIGPTIGFLADDPACVLGWTLGSVPEGDVWGQASFEVFNRDISEWILPTPSTPSGG